MVDVVAVHREVASAAREIFGKLAFPTFKYVRGQDGTKLDGILIRGFTPAVVYEEGGRMDYQGSSGDTPTRTRFKSLVGRIVDVSVDKLEELSRT